MTKITSLKQVEANKKNAQKSTGPKSFWGKHKASGNALTHGLDAKKHLIMGEDTKEFEDYRSSMIHMLDPINPIQEESALQIVSAGWRIRRFASVEAGLFDYEQKDSKEYLVKYVGSQLNGGYTPSMLQGLGFRSNCVKDNAFLKLSTIEQRLLTRYYKLLDLYDQMKKERVNTL